MAYPNQNIEPEILKIKTRPKTSNGKTWSNMF